MLLELDFAAEEPIYLQIRNRIVRGIADGDLKPGERLPTLRALALEAGINVMTVNRAYALLKQEGFITADRRSGASVTISPKPGMLTRKNEEVLRLIISEAKLAGMSKEAFITLCGRIYEGE